MTKRDFLKQNRREIDAAIARFYGENCRPSNDAEREQWLLNDEGLYHWARGE